MKLLRVEKYMALFAVGYSLFYYALFINSIAISDGLKENMNNVLKLFACFFLLASVFSKRLKFKSLPIMLFVMMTSLLFLISSRDIFFCTLFLIALSSYHFDSRIIFVISRYLLLMSTILVIIACGVGLLPDVITIRSFFDDFSRHSFGFAHSNVLPNAIVMLIAYTLVVKEYCLSICEYVFFLLIIGLAFYYCRGYNGLISSLSLLVLSCISVNKKNWSSLLTFTPIILSILSFLPFFYISNSDMNEFWATVDFMLTNRISLGQYVVENIGFNFINFMSTKEYFSIARVLDNGYMYIGLRYGIFLLVLLCLLLRHYLNSMIRYNDIKMLYLFNLILISNVIDNMFFSYLMLPFLVCAVKIVFEKTFPHQY